MQIFSQSHPQGGQSVLKTVGNTIHFEEVVIPNMELNTLLFSSKVYSTDLNKLDENNPISQK